MASGKKKATPPPDLASKTKIEVTAWLLEQATSTYQAATAAASFVAAQSALKQIKELRGELETERMALGEGVRSEEQFVIALTERVAELATPHLEIAVKEYLRRHPGMALV